MSRTFLVAIQTTVVVLGICVACWQAGRGQAADIPAAGPRGPIGPDTPLSAAEQGRLARRGVVEGRPAAAVRAACERAAKEGATAVFLPAGEYDLDAEVRVPGRLTILGDGSKTVVRAQGKKTCLFRVDGDLVRFTRMKIEGADTTVSQDNDTHGISAYKSQNVRIDHCELSGFSHATTFGDEATAQIDHCSIHDNLRDGLGYGVAVYSGAYVLVADNEFSQNRHSLASNGSLDWNSPRRAGKYLHKPGPRKTHWEFLHNRVGSNDRSRYELCAVDTHPGMDGTFVVEGNLFEDLRHGVGIRDGSGIIRGNVFRNLRTVTKFRPLVAISIAYGTHNKVPVDGCMPHHVVVERNVVVVAEGVKYEKCQIGKAENLAIDGKPVCETAGLPAPRAIRLQEMGEDGVLRWSESPLPRPPEPEK